MSPNALKQPHHEFGEEDDEQEVACVRDRNDTARRPISSETGLSRKIIMEPIEKRYIVDEQNRRVAVQIDAETFRRIEELLEDYVLFQLMEETEAEDVLGVEKARAFYASLPKAE